MEISDKPLKNNVKSNIINKKEADFAKRKQSDKTVLSCFVKNMA